ncbi:MAG: putative NAD/FAD-binding protein [Acidimicrobiales bacterium]|jgi:uncharacterized protein
MRLAIIGSGIAGLTCSHVLGRAHDVVLYEADDRLGGHANTVTVHDPEAGELQVDTGFIVHNDRNYPNFVRLLTELRIGTIDTEMSFAVSDRSSGFAYRATNLDTLFADRSNALRPAMWRMLVDIARFYRLANRYLAAGGDDRSIGSFLTEGNFSPAFIDLHLVPMGAAVWSADPSTFDDIPAHSLLSFLSNHGLLGIGNRPQWRTIEGGSRTYVDAIASRFRGEIRLSTPVAEVVRTNDGVVVVDRAGERQHFDRVILACHSDQALRLLADPLPTERRVLSAFRYQPNRAILHTDTAMLPELPKVWAAWNYEHHGPNDLAANVTYDMTNLQRLPGANRYLVSLNPADRIARGRTIASFDYSHPVFDQPAVEAQAAFDKIDGEGGVHFCGAYWGHGFHEDGMVSALRVCQALGVDW